ncbi:MAG: flavodoxin-dependent (E)-4-hydroxy-3-methylbut-2-enyl-diphosphate synthase [Deltaproteobacteria bacterium]
MNLVRRKARVIKIGKVSIGDAYPIAIQSMTKCKTSDVASTVKQVRALEDSGCEIVRLAVKDGEDAAALKKIRGRIKIPLVADIHFDWHLALKAIDNGADKIRLNPGNIYKNDQLRQIVAAARSHRIPIRVGLNSGSIPKNYSSGRSPSDRMVGAALDYVKILEGFGFYDIVISLKASGIRDTVEAYRKIAKLLDYPLHLGMTATGAPYAGLMKSSIAMGALLLDGLGDTIRISLTDNPREEVRAARCILETLGLRHFGPQIISCPTCGRCEVDLIKIVKDLERSLSKVNHKFAARQIKIAVMGCVVNGPGEAQEADIGVAFGKKEGLIFRNGAPFKKVAYGRCLGVLLKEIARSNG